MIALVSRRSTVLLRESFGGVILQCRSVLISTSNYGKEINDDSYPMEIPHDPWPLSHWIYGDGWKGYRMLMMPNIETTSTWTIKTSKKLINETSNIGKEIYRLSHLDSKTICLLLVDKSKQSLEQLIIQLNKTKDETVDLVKNGKVKELADNGFLTLKSLSDALNKLIAKNLKENAKISAIKTGTVMAASDKLYSNSCEVEKPKDHVSKTKSLGQTITKFVHSNSNVYLTINSLISQKYFSSEQFKRSSRSHDMLYVDKYLDKSNKMPKQNYHSLTYVETRIFSQPQLSLNSHRLLSKVEIGEYSSSIPDSMKKLWQKLRDNKLPGWQATISSILQKIQDCLLKKKK